MMWPAIHVLSAVCIAAGGVEAVKALWRSDRLLALVTAACFFSVTMRALADAARILAEASS